VPTPEYEEQILSLAAEAPEPAPVVHAVVVP
jgi:hypothetical protein